MGPGGQELGGACGLRRGGAASLVLGMLMVCFPWLKFEAALKEFEIICK